MLARHGMIERNAGGFLEAAAALRHSPPPEWSGPLAFGVDLGTATIVITAVDAASRPVYWDSLACAAVRDGVVVNFADAVAAVRQLKARAHAALRTRIDEAATAYPPCVPEAEARACRYVLESAEITCRSLVDEVTAAQALLQIRDGAIADVGGGSTGVGIIRNGVIVALTDEPGGGHHLDLILAGALGIPVEEAERRKRLGEADYAAILRPGVERIGSSIARQIGGAPASAVHLAGGAIRVPGAAAEIARITGLPVTAYPHSDLITPFGISLG
jgi:ethanolamine utilization protein EutJ